MPTDNLAVARDVAPARARLGRFDFLGLRLDDMDGDAIARAASSAVRERRSLLVLNANAHMVVLSKRQPWLRALLGRADIAFCDGAGVQLAAWVLNGHRPHRTTPPEWIDRFAAALPAGASVFWLGGAPEVVDLAARRFSERHGVRTAGVQHGFFDQRPGSDENEAVVRRINRASPDVLLVNMGMPLQERWLDENWHRVDARVAIAAGALVDHVAGRVSRPAGWVADAGLEWLVRLVREPRRLWRRYILGLPIFGLYVARDLLDPKRPGRRGRMSERTQSVR